MIYPTPTHLPQTDPGHPVLPYPRPTRPDFPQPGDARAWRQPTPITFNRYTLRHLSARDQMLFERFGHGPLAAVPYTTIHHAFEDHASANPDAVAARHLDDTITYGELDRQANRLAATLMWYGVRTGDNVALFLQRSIPMVVGIMAALKAGASYVPQHVGVAPTNHLEYVIVTAQTRVILTLSSLQHLIVVPDGHLVIAVDEFMQQPFADSTEFCVPFTPATPIRPDNTCYIIFTSGTTGKPNGVQVTHGNVTNLLLTRPGNLGMRPGITVAQILSIAFDMAAWEILGCLSNGATLIIRGKDFMETIQQANVVISTPSILSTFDANRCHNVKVVAVAGEPCPRPLAEKWAQFTTFYNSCGPTEVTIVNTMQYFRSNSSLLTIGKPTPNNTVYILDENLQPCPIGTVGEMWAGGDCVSTGYIGNDTLTTDRYRPDPFLGGGRLMFRTRDLGRWTADGELEHFGRTDDQVKIRGFRVELDSVSAVLEAVPHCKRATALKLDDRHLVAFVSPQTVDVAAAQDAVAVALPYYCMPKFILALDELPLTSRGKIDKRRLMQMAVSQDTAVQQEPESMAVQS